MDQDLKKHIKKTGTTTIGIVCKDGIVVAADQQGSYGGDGGVSYISGGIDKKVLEVTPDIIVTIAGVASDLFKLVKVVKAELKLKELKAKSRPTIKQAANLFASIAYQNIRQPSMIPAITHFLLSGKDQEGIHLYDITPDGLLKKIDTYQATGSGMIHCNPILDSEYKEGLSLQEGIKLARKCIKASMGRDPASGAGMDIYTVTKDEIKQVSRQKAELDFKDE